MATEAGLHRAAPQSEARRGLSRAPLMRTVFQRTLRALLRLIRAPEAEAHHLHAVEQKGEAGETPFIAILGLVLFFLPVCLVVMGLAFAAYYVA